MSEHTTQGGTDWELRAAEDALVAAGDDPVAQAKARRRHLDAIRNMMQGAIVPSFVKVVERTISDEVSKVLSAVEVFGARLGKLEDTTEALTGIVSDHDETIKDHSARLGVAEVQIADHAVQLADQAAQLAAHAAQLATLARWRATLDEWRKNLGGA